MRLKPVLTPDGRLSASSGFGAVIMFVTFFLAGFYYIIKKGALNWED